jgi:rubrerythrin
MAGSQARRAASKFTRFISVPPECALPSDLAGDANRLPLVKTPTFLFRIFLIKRSPTNEVAVKRFADLSEQEILALAITNEEEDSRIYRGFAEGLRAQYPASAKVFEEMADEEVRHRTMLFDLYRSKFGEYLPLIRRQDVKGFIPKKPLWLMPQLNLDEVRKFAENMEFEAARFYRKATETTRDTSVRQLLVELAEAEVEHESLAHKLEQKLLTPTARAEEDETARRMFLLQYVQPGLAGLMDGSVSTLAPLFAAAFATHNTWETFLVGMAASVGAGISMGFAEAASDDGSLTGRGTPWLRGTVCGVMTAIGGVGHTLPYLIPDFWLATILAVIVVAVELVAISYIRYRYMDTPFLSAAFQIVVGGTLVFLAGILIGSS